MTRQRALDWVLVVTLTGMTVGLFARGIAQGLCTGLGQLRVHVSSAPDANVYPFVLSASSTTRHPRRRLAWYVNGAPPPATA